MFSREFYKNAIHLILNRKALNGQKYDLSTAKTLYLNGLLSYTMSKLDFKL